MFKSGCYCCNYPCIATGTFITKYNVKFCNDCAKVLKMAEGMAEEITDKIVRQEMEDINDLMIKIDWAADSQ